MKHRTHGYVTDSLGPEEEEMGKWWRSEDTILSENPYNSFIVRKDWPLKEAINMHFVRLQQESHRGDPRFSRKLKLLTFRRVWSTGSWASPPGSGRRRISSSPWTTSNSRSQF